MLQVELSLHTDSNCRLSSCKGSQTTSQIHRTEELFEIVRLNSIVEFSSHSYHQMSLVTMNSQ